MLFFNHYFADVLGSNAVFGPSSSTSSENLKSRHTAGEYSRCPSLRTAFGWLPLRCLRLTSAHV